MLVPDANLDTSSLPAKPDEVLVSLEEFQPEKYGLPPFDSGNGVY